MKRWMLDTNVVSNAIHRRSSALDDKVAQRPVPDLCVSAIVYGEVCFGIAQKPQAQHLSEAIDGFFREIQIIPWTVTTAGVYGDLRASMKREGKSLSPLDMLIAAHALEAGATLVTSDRAFRFVPGLRTEDWTAA